MSELSLIIDDWGHKELQEYLLSLKGIMDVVIKNENKLEIYVKYDSNLITFQMIKMEILLFLGILKRPSILAFDKHSNIKTSEYIIIRKDICCEFCYMGAIEDLFEIEGIEKVESNYVDKYLFEKYDEGENITINIEYDSSLIVPEKMKQIEIELII